MRDPLTIAHLRMFPRTNPGWMTTRSAGKLYPVHVHTAFLDADGNGTTSIACSHFHRLRGGAILPDESDGHVHARTNLPGGMGI
jgi:hypothetical protein